MRRPYRRLHLFVWVILSAAVAAGGFAVLSLPVPDRAEAFQPSVN